MKQVRNCIFLFLLLLFSYTGHAFSQALHVGDICPDIELQHIINYLDSKARLSEFKGKLIILDFWGTGCIGCIRSFPHMDSLQKRFGDSIQIIMINKETEDSTKNFFSLHKKIRLPSLPFVTQDSILSTFFPHVFVPHQIWLTDQYKVLAITGGYNATEEHIADFLQNNSIELSLKTDINPTAITMPVMFYSDSTRMADVPYYSYIMPAVSSLNLGYQRESTGDNDKANRIIMNRASTLKLLQIAFGEDGKFDFMPTNTVVLDVKDKKKYDYPADNNLYDLWSQSYSFLYELKVPVTKADSLYKFMQQDLQRFFNLEATIEKRKIPCYALIRTSKQVKLNTDKSDFTVQDFKTDSGTVIQYKAMPFEQFIWNLRYDFSSNLKEVIVDETGLEGSFTISYSNRGLFNEINKEINIQAYRQLLHSFDLDIVKKECITNVLIIREKL